LATVVVVTGIVVVTGGGTVAGGSVVGVVASLMARLTRESAADSRPASATVRAITVSISGPFACASVARSWATAVKEPMTSRMSRPIGSGAAMATTRWPASLIVPSVLWAAALIPAGEPPP